MGGEQCYLVKLTWKSGRETFDCYSGKSGAHGRIEERAADFYGRNSGGHDLQRVQEVR